MNPISGIWKSISRLSPSCQEAIRLQSDALDRDLPPSQRLGLRIHLVLCGWCRRYGKQIAFLREASRVKETPGAGVSQVVLSPEAKERIKQSLHPKKG